MNKNGTSGGALEDRMGNLKESVRNLVDAGGERASQIKERLYDAKDVAVDKGSAALGRLSALVKEHPIAALGIAFGIGYLTIRMLRK
jgi:ElaB/YqjD/DUF883 family membrane-anchored ribosome-binding protein